MHILPRECLLLWQALFVHAATLCEGLRHTAHYWLWAFAALTEAGQLPPRKLRSVLPRRLKHRLSRCCRLRRHSMAESVVPAPTERSFGTELPGMARPTCS